MSTNSTCCESALDAIQNIGVKSAEFARGLALGDLKRLGEILSSDSCALEELDYRCLDNNDTYPQIEELAKALRFNQSLRVLRFKAIRAPAAASEERLTAIRQLSFALEHNQSLRELTLSVCYFDTAGATELSRALRKNQTLAKLNLPCGNIGSDGILALAESLLQNDALTRLDLSYNPIGDQGAVSLAAVLQYNKTLTRLHLKGIAIEIVGLKALAVALLDNRTLEQLLYTPSWRDGRDQYFYRLICELLCSETRTRATATITQSRWCVPTQEALRRRAEHLWGLRQITRLRQEEVVAEQAPGPGESIHRTTELLKKAELLSARYRAIETESFLLAFEENCSVRARLEFLKEARCTDSEPTDEWTLLTMLPMNELSRSSIAEKYPNTPDCFFGAWSSVLAHRARSWDFSHSLATVYASLAERFRGISDSMPREQTGRDVANEVVLDNFDARTLERYEKHLSTPIIPDDVVDALDRAVDQFLVDNAKPVPSRPPTPANIGIGTCVVCLENTACYIVEECNHLCYCEDCNAADGDSTRCPRCSQPAWKRRRIFL